MTEMAEAYVNEKGEWDYRPLANPPAYLTATMKFNYDVDSIIEMLRDGEDPEIVAEHGYRVYTLDDLVSYVQDLASEDFCSGDLNFYIETDDGKIVG